MCGHEGKEINSIICHAKNKIVTTRGKAPKKRVWESFVSRGPKKETKQEQQTHTHTTIIFVIKIHEKAHEKSETKKTNEIYPGAKRHNKRLNLHKRTTQHK